SVFRGQHRRGIFLGRTLDAIGDVARQRGQIERAVAVGREALAILEKEGGADHPFSLLAAVHTGAALWAAGQAAEGERLLRAGLGGLEREFPGGHFDLASARVLLAERLALSGRGTEALPLLRQALEWRQAHLGSADPRTAAARRALDS
ncbi:MAG TPA: tetratricopeptide repeat protein, partial [Thermoanaerobaculia bacterium]|nr:tetratricopeptide repeat protein [Thermoanaerobaculia bacterium]